MTISLKSCLSLAACTCFVSLPKAAASAFGGCSLHFRIDADVCGPRHRQSARRRPLLRRTGGASRTPRVSLEAAAEAVSDTALIIVVAGATGKVGSLLVRQLLRRKHSSLRVIALARDAKKVQALHGDDVRTVEADYTDMDALRTALGSEDLPRWRMFLACGNGPQQGQAELNLLAVAEAYACEYVVKLSTVRTVLEAQSGGPYRAHLEVEKALLASTKVEYKTVLRPNLFMQMLQAGPLGVGNLLKSADECEHPYKDSSISMIDCEDIAAVASELLMSEDPSKYNAEKLDLTGPSAVSISEAIDIVSKLRPRPVSCTACSVAALVDRMGLPAHVATGLQSFFDIVGRSDFVSNHVQEILGRPARSIADFIYDCPEPFLPTTFSQLVGRGKDVSFRAGTSVTTSDLSKALSEMQSGQLFLKVLVAGVNAGADSFRITNAGPAEANFPLGVEGVGQVVSVGNDVVNFAVGDIVSFVGGFAYSEYTSVDAVRCLRILPNGAALAEFVALRVSALTAAVALHHTAGMRESDVVLVTAACGATGSFAVQLAHLAGATVIGTVGSKEKVEVVKNLGCDRVVNYREEDLGTVLSGEFPDGIDIAYEGVGGSLFRAAHDNLAEGGRILVVGAISTYPHNESPAKHNIDGLEEVMEIFRLRKTVELPGGRRIIGNVWGDSFDTGRMIQERDRLHQLHATGELQANIESDRFEGMDAIPDAVEYMLSGANVGKVWVKCTSS